MTTVRAVMLAAAREELVTCGEHLADAALSARIAFAFLWSAWKAGKTVSELRPMPEPSAEAEENWDRYMRNKPLCPVHGNDFLDCGAKCPFHPWGHA